MSDPQRVDTAPDAAEFCALRLAAGMSARSEDAARIGLPASLFATTLRVDGELVAMGRVVGDGGCSFEVVDVAVHPGWQRRGLGVRIMGAIRDWLDANAPPSAFVSMIADHHSPALYAKFGFAATAPDSIGMGYRVPDPAQEDDA